MNDLMKLKAARELITKQKAVRDKLLEDIKNKNIVFKTIEILEGERDELELSIRNQALIIYEKTGDKKIGQIGIRIMKDIIYDQEIAFKWAKEHSLCLNLDKKNFEKLAKTQDIEFVEIKERPIATIPTKIKIEDLKNDSI